MDPMQIRLNEVLYCERLAAAEQARRRATWVAAPGLIERLWPAIKRQLSALGRQVHARLTPVKFIRKIIQDRPGAPIRKGWGAWHWKLLHCGHGFILAHLTNNSFKAIPSFICSKKEIRSSYGRDFDAIIKALLLQGSKPEKPSLSSRTQSPTSSLYALSSISLLRLGADDWYNAISWIS